VSGPTASQILNRPTMNSRMEEHLIADLFFLNYYLHDSSNIVPWAELGFSSWGGGLNKG